jgi:hypothetical protein
MRWVGLAVAVCAVVAAVLLWPPPDDDAASHGQPRDRAVSGHAGPDGRGAVAEHNHEHVDLRDPSFASFHEQVADQLVKQEEHRVRQGDPRQFVRRADHEITPASTRQWLRPGASEELCAMLGDSAYAEQWARIAKTICLSSSDGRSVVAVLDYLRRAEDWQGLSPGAMSQRCLGKIDSLQWLGFVQAEQAAAALAEALTPEGAAKLTQAWRDGPLPPWTRSPRQDLLGVVRGNAAIGIAHAQDPRGMAQVAAAYEQARADADRQPFVSVYAERLARALAINDLIQSIGRGSYAELMGTAEYDRALEPFEARRMWWNQ